MKVIVVHYYHLLNIALMVKAFHDSKGVSTILLVHDNLVSLLDEMGITDYDVLCNFDRYVHMSNEIICHHHLGAMQIVKGFYGVLNSVSLESSISISYFADGFRNSLLSVEDRDMLVNDSRGLLKPGQIFVFGCINAEHKIKTGAYQLVVIPYRYFFQGLRIGGVSNIDNCFIKDAESFSLRLVVAIRPWGSEKYMNGKYAHSDASKRLFSVLVKLIDDICFAAESVIILFKGDSRDVELSHQVFSRLCAHYRYYILT